MDVWAVIVGAVLAVLGLGIGIRLGARRVRAPISSMTDAAAQIAAGDPDAHIPVDVDRGLAELATTINQLTNEFRSRVDEAREDRRTRDLVLAALDEGVLLIGAGAEVRYANPAALRLVGRIAAETRSAAGDAGRPYVPPALRTLVEEARDSGMVREIEIEIGRPTRTVLASSFPVGGDGLALLVLRDVTEARRVDSIRRDFVAAASHELKTPVASIQAAAETLSHAVDEDREAALRFVGHLIRDSERLSRIVRDLLDLSRLESERASFAPVRLDALAHEELDRMSERIRDAALEIDVDSTPVTVSGSGQDLSLLISNLLDNAVRYTRPGGRIRLEVAARNGDAKLTVSDTGVGIPARDLPRIFERFYRVDRARSRDTGGTGLGLAIVKHVAEQHGGRVEAQSEFGRGTTFVVTIPTSS